MYHLKMPKIISLAGSPGAVCDSWFCSQKFESHIGLLKKILSLDNIGYEDPWQYYQIIWMYSVLFFKSLFFSLNWVVKTLTATAFVTF